MKTPHIHAELIKAWADGAEIERLNIDKTAWFDVPSPEWGPNATYRIKPEPKPDSILLRRIELITEKGGLRVLTFGSSIPNVQLTFDGETKQLKAVEMIK